MRKTDKYKYSLYYKGEEENPFDPGDVRSQWWWYESHYFFNGLPGDHNRWEKEALKCIHDIPEIEILMNSCDVPIETKGFLCYSVATTLCHNAMAHFSFFREYGRGFFPDYHYDGSPEPIEWTDEVKFNFCLYYKGEQVCPYEYNDDRHTFWDMEKSWFKLVAGNEDRGSKYVFSFCLDFGGGLDEYNIECTLKATMYELFTHFGGTKDAFPAFLTNYLALAKKR